MTSSDEVTNWLLDGDPSVVWQAQRDLLDISPTTWEATQARVATRGWGAQLLAERGADDRWAGGLYSPKWTSTTYTLLQLWRMGLPRDNPDAVASTKLLMDKPVWVFGSSARPNRDECVAGFGLALSSWFTIADDRRERLVGEVLERQLADGGWNCRAKLEQEQKHSSFHTTINVLEGLREYCLSEGGQSGAVETAEARAREFFCSHHLYRSHRTGKIPDERMTRLPFPPRWHHDILRGLDYFRAASAERDPRLEEAISLVQGYQRKDGRWPLHAGYSGKVWFTMESGRNPSRWNTLRARRVMRWWTQT
ncbi:MAG: hypothetical protein OEY55_14560 [Acidimicrobiia bacterium]|nr:hypothetical protein [Acidimicrobiia bacterium]MDH5504501.1 hypothetical protein [Acidimicrobiia bacterium]